MVKELLYQLRKHPHKKYVHCFHWLWNLYTP